MTDECRVTQDLRRYQENEEEIDRLTEENRVADKKILSMKSRLSIGDQEDFIIESIFTYDKSMTTSERCHENQKLLKSWAVGNREVFASILFKRFDLHDQNIDVNESEL